MDLMNHLEAVDSLVSERFQLDEKIDEAKKTRNKLLDPILNLLGSGYGFTDDVTVDEKAGELSVTKTWSCRGYAYDDRYVYPLHIFKAPNPLVEAQKWLDDQLLAKDKAARERKIRQLEELVKELGESI